MSEAIIIVDAQRGFMPADSERTLQQGYGELSVPGGHEIIGPLNRLAASGLAIATTQDWHPSHTAHFAAEDSEPDFSTTWPRHCVDGTPGAELHPGLKLPPAAVRFHKGMEALRRGEDDTSYSRFNARNLATNHGLPDWLRDRGVSKLLVVGLALDYCVRATALDFQRAGYQVAVATDACRAVNEGSGRRTLGELAAAGVQLTTSDEWLGK